MILKRLPWRVKFRFRIIFASALCAAVLASGFIMLTLYQTYTEQLETRAQDRGRLPYVRAVARERRGRLLRAASTPDNRITLVAPDGTVLYDNTADASKMENHAGRPEIQAALQSGSGETHRFSDTLVAGDDLLRDPHRRRQRAEAFQ